MIINKEYTGNLIKDFLAEGESLESISQTMELPISVIINILNEMKTTVIYNVYVLDDSDNIFDCCGEFNTLKEARDYIKYLEAEDMKRLINDKYAIYINIETFIE